MSEQIVWKGFDEFKQFLKPISELELDPVNARKHSERNINVVANSLRDLGQHRIAVAKGNVVTVGNGMLVAARNLGWTHLAVVESGDDEKMARVRALTDNRSGDSDIGSDWDFPVLADILTELDSGEFNLDAIGFNAEELEEIMTWTPPEDEKPTTEDEPPEPPEDPYSKTGDLWLLGKHRLLCGDSTKAEDVARVMDENEVNLIVTDPPYGMNFQSNHRKEKHDKIEGDDSLPVEAIIALTRLASHATYVFCRWNNLPDMPEPKSVLAWVKNNWSMGDLEHEHGRQWEAICFYPSTKHKFTKRIPDVIHADRTGNELHPTEKPVSLMTEIIMANEGRNVFDPYIGSGTVLIATEQLGRIAYGCEIDPKYVDVTCQRYYNLTGVVPVNAETDEMFPVKESE